MYRPVLERCPYFNGFQYGIMYIPYSSGNNPMGDEPQVVLQRGRGGGGGGWVDVFSRVMPMILRHISYDITPTESHI